MSVDTHADTHAALVAVLGPDPEARLAATKAETQSDWHRALVAAAIEAHHGDVAAAAGVNVDGDTAAYLQRLVGSNR
jgi:hypothetical protein